LTFFGEKSRMARVFEALKVTNERNKKEQNIEKSWSGYLAGE